MDDTKAFDEIRKLVANGAPTGDVAARLPAGYVLEPRTACPSCNSGYSARSKDKQLICLVCGLTFQQ